MKQVVLCILHLQCKKSLKKLKTNANETKQKKSLNIKMNRHGLCYPTF